MQTLIEQAFECQLDGDAIEVCPGVPNGPGIFTGSKTYTEADL